MINVQQVTGGLHSTMSDDRHIVFTCKNEKELSDSLHSFFMEALKQIGIILNILKVLTISVLQNQRKCFEYNPNFKSVSRLKVLACNLIKTDKEKQA